MASISYLAGEPGKYGLKKVHVSGAKGGKQSNRAFVFVHGMASDGTTFSHAIAALTANELLSKCDYYCYDYPWLESIASNGRQLRDLFNARDGGQALGVYDRVDLICHSMGGLVARIALLCGDSIPSNVRTLTMFGTPNFGAMREALLGVATTIGIVGVGRMISSFIRKKGVADLTRADKIIADLIGRGPSKRTVDSVEYVTIPGLVYGANGARTDVDSILLRCLHLVERYMPSLFGRFEVPHDGIVEESSNCMIDHRGDVTEKDASIHATDRSVRPTYFHVVHDDCGLASHVDVHTRDEIVAMLGGILAAGSVREWYDPDEMAKYISVYCHSRQVVCDAFRST